MLEVAIVAGWYDACTALQNDGTITMSRMRKMATPNSLPILAITRVLRLG
jgi:hypothetical protein